MEILDCDRKDYAMGKALIHKCKLYTGNPYNEVWEKRENTVHGDIVYCWHCGLKVQLK